MFNVLPMLLELVTLLVLNLEHYISQMEIHVLSVQLILLELVTQPVTLKDSTLLPSLPQPME